MLAVCHYLGKGTPLNHEMAVTVFGEALDSDDAAFTDNTLLCLLERERARDARDLDQTEDDELDASPFPSDRAMSLDQLRTDVVRHKDDADYHQRCKTLRDRGKGWAGAVWCKP